ncbi:hypothetical protein ENTCAN_07358 [Enterobacter cancerogenus ATCC 35316]|nr:hypothetical protein ENTCAN_07358 [Enterobacter cancerogenus ATCC 35316]
MPDVCGTKRISLPESEEGRFTKVGFLFLAPDRAVENMGEG